MSYPTAVEAVLRTLLTDPPVPDGWYGLAVMRATGRRPGAIYPAINLLRHRGLIAAQGEDIDPVAEGRPRRVYLRLTEAGEEEARKVQDRVTVDREDLRIVLGCAVRPLPGTAFEAALGRLRKVAG